MLNTAPYNTSVPQFRPQKENPIFPSITKKYPCEETYAGKKNFFRRISWKIQQPDPNMVWTSVKLVLPLEMDFLSKDPNHANNAVLADARLMQRLGLCNMALAETPMKAFRATSLTLNGKVFTEQNIWKDVMDSCYRGVGPQAYGSNHSLQPVVTRAIMARSHNIRTYNAAGLRVDTYVRSTDIPSYNNVASNLDNNGPFIERARIFQQQLDDTGTKWVGEISSYLEIGPFQARARQGNTAVPYIEDFHLQMDFHSQPSKFDQQCATRYNMAPSSAQRYMPPRLLEFATLPNYRPRGAQIPDSQFLAGVDFTWTAKPYLEVTYTKFPEPMRPGYQLRCYERQYEQSLPRFTFDLTQQTRVHQAVPARITSRLLSYPTKIYLWGEQSDDTKGAFIDGGCRRSCTLSNIHCRINQRPSVIDSPRQEDLFEMFQRHTNSDLEYATWRKSPIYCFTPADLGQPDLHANDARLTWFEFDANVSLTDLQLREQQDKEYAPYMSLSGYDLPFEQSNWDYSGVHNTTVIPTPCLDPRLTGRYTQRDGTPGMAVLNQWDQSSDKRKGCADVRDLGQSLVNQDFVLGEQFSKLTGHRIPDFSEMDIRPRAITAVSQKFRGLIFAKVNMNPAANGQAAGASYGDIDGARIFWCPVTWGMAGMPNIADKNANIINDFSELTANMTQAPNNHLTDDAYPKVSNPASIVAWSGHFYDPLGDAGRYTNNDLVGSTYANRNNGTARSLPGQVAYRIMARGLLNTDDNNAANQQPAWQPPFTRGQDGWTEIDERASAFRWCAFGVNDDLFNAATVNGIVYNHLRPYFSKYDLVKDVRVWTGYGDHIAVYETTATYGNVDGGNSDNGAANNIRSPNYPDYSVGAGTAHPDPYYGARYFQQYPQLIPVKYERDQDIVPTEYQMKVLYEFGNCQYEFVRGAPPVRVRPNLIPVGPSPGLPMLE